MSDADHSQEYGLPVPRDRDGELQSVEHTYEWQGHEVTIKLVPPTIADLREYEQFGDETETDDLMKVYERHIVEPSVPTDAVTMRELLCYIEGVIDYGAAGGSDLVAQAQEALDERSDPGNEG